MVKIPVIRCSNGKWRIGSGRCIYKDKKTAERVMRALKAKGIISRDVGEVFGKEFLTGDADVDIEKINDLSTVGEIFRGGE